MTTILGVERDQRRESLVPLAKLPVLLSAGLLAIVLLAVSGRYGYFGDELYFVVAGHHLSWGYADQPPMLPLIALLMDTIAPGSLTALRIPSILVASLGVVVAALIAREFHGGRRAQTLTAAAHAIAFATATTTLATPVFDVFCWTVLSWLVVRWVRTYLEGAADDRLLLWAGVVTALAVQVKFQVGVFVVLLLVTALILGPRPLLRRPMLWAGAAIAAVVSVPTLVWQTVNGWPQMEMTAAVAAEMKSIGPVTNAALVIVSLGVGIGLVLGIYGLWRLLTAPGMRPYRFLGWTALAVVVLFLAAGGRFYYASGVFPVLWAAGAVGFQQRRELKQGTGRRVWSWVAWPAIALSALVSLQGLPWQPVESYAGKPYDLTQFLYLGQIGWPQAAETVADAYRKLPPEQQRTTAIVGSDYWIASALEHYGPDWGLPKPYSGARGFWYFGRPPEQATTMLHVGPVDPAWKKYFGEFRKVATLDNGLDIATIQQGSPVFVATDRQAPWSRIWPEIRRINLVE